jgi:hypothetical protein
MENINRRVSVSINFTKLNGFKPIAINPTNTTFYVKYYVAENTKFQLQTTVIIKNTIQFFMYDAKYKKRNNG